MGCSSSQPSKDDNWYGPHRVQPAYHVPHDNIPQQYANLVIFPLRYPPTCNKQNPSSPRICQHQTLRFFTSSNNENGNYNRPYYTCPNHFDRQGHRREEWKCWDDYIGLDPANPRCHCDLPSRQSRKSKRHWDGNYNPWHGYGFWSCAIGHCSYYSDDRYGKVSYGFGESGCAPFEPWQLGHKRLSDGEMVALYAAANR